MLLLCLLRFEKQGSVPGLQTKSSSRLFEKNLFLDQNPDEARVRPGSVNSSLFPAKRPSPCLPVRSGEQGPGTRSTVMSMRVWGTH